VSGDLDALVARMREVDQYVACSVGRTPEHDRAWWLTPERLATGAGALERLADAYGERWGVAGDRASQASFIVLDYSWYAFAPLVAALLAEGVLPSLRGASVWLDPATREGSLALSPAEVPAPATVDDLRAEIETHLAPIVDAIAERRWLSRRVAWWGAGDRVVGAIEHIGDAIGDRDAARKVAERLVHHAGSPLDSPRHRFVEVAVAGHVRAVGLRASCCRFYRVPDVEYCFTCPILPEAERMPKLRAWIAEDLAAAGSGG
jgi:FhuF 2Fe-2S C-terminal domain